MDDMKQICQSIERYARNLRKSMMVFELAVLTDSPRDEEEDDKLVEKVYQDEPKPYKVTFGGHEASFNSYNECTFVLKEFRRRTEGMENVPCEMTIQMTDGTTRQFYR